MASKEPYYPEYDPFGVYYEGPPPNMDTISLYWKVEGTTGLILTPEQASDEGKLHHTVCSAIVKKASLVAVAISGAESSIQAHETIQHTLYHLHSLGMQIPVYDRPCVPATIHQIEIEDYQDPSTPPVRFRERVMSGLGNKRIVAYLEVGWEEPTIDEIPAWQRNLFLEDNQDAS